MNPVFCACRYRDNVAVKELNLCRGLGSPFQDVRISPPAEKSGRVEIMQRLYFESGAPRNLRYRSPGVSPVMAEQFVDWAIENGKRRDDENRDPARRKHAGHVAQGLAVVLDVF